MLTLIAQPDTRDWAAGPALGIDYREHLEQGVNGLRIGYSPTLGYAKVDAEVAKCVARAANEFTQLGAKIEEIDLKLDDPIEIMRPLWAVALALAVAPMSPAQRALCDPGMLELAEPGFALSALEYRQLERARDAFGRRMLSLHDQYDLLVTPQLATTAFAVGHEVPPDSGMKRWWQWSPFTYPFNLTQQPAATVPCGFAANGLPVAMQVVGAMFADALVLRAARAYEKAHPFVLPKAT
jgi:aspartyl-tRNA(Asn)/glutamyl-tRNA(Gln) amidotransferase subunit A